MAAEQTFWAKRHENNDMQCGKCYGAQFPEHAPRCRSLGKTGGEERIMKAIQDYARGLISINECMDLVTKERK